MKFLTAFSLLFLCCISFAQTETHSIFYVKRGGTEIMPVEAIIEPPKFLVSSKTVKLIAKKFKKLVPPKNAELTFNSAFAINITSEDKVDHIAFYDGGTDGQLLCFFDTDGNLGSCETSGYWVGYDGLREIFVDLGDSKTLERVHMESVEEGEDYFAVFEINSRTLKSKKLFNFIPVSEYKRKGDVVTFESEDFSMQGAKIDLSYKDGKILIKSLPRHCMARTEDAGANFTGVETMRMPLIQFIKPNTSNSNSFSGPALGLFELGDLIKGAEGISDDLKCEKNSDCKIITYAGKKLTTNKSFSIPDICKGANNEWIRMSWDSSILGKPKCLNKPEKKGKYCY